MKYQKPQPVLRDFNAMTSTRTPQQKQAAKTGLYTSLVMEPGMPGFNGFGNKKTRRWNKVKAKV